MTLGVKPVGLNEVEDRFKQDNYLCDGSRLVISSNELDAVRIAEFEASQQTDCLNAIVATIDIVA